MLFITSCYFLIIISQTIVSIDTFQQNGTNNSKQFQIEEDLTTLNYYFFSYDIIDHKTILIKFDITHTMLFQQRQVLYNAYLHISKLPSENYKINIGPFLGYYEKEISGTITDHFTFCLVLLPSQHQNSSQKQQIIHYCTKMGPDEDHERHPIKQGSKGDHILLLLQLLMIVIILTILQITHTIRKRNSHEWYLRRISRFRYELLRRKEFIDMPNETLAMLRFISINSEEPQEEIDESNEDREEGKEEEEEKEVNLIYSHRRLPERGIRYQRSRSPSPSINSMNINSDTFSIEHILKAKPWLQIPH
ncbi:unnamed protein product [Adineta steineri]|uniref:Uncharacterized protein n=1 Tax=Adineta steineri TaxID=433720 RepID=A0A815UME5_9BILA|nr:unnamed protein product [Adineta steineri]CAF1519147.1 unnamed protein product [Adineta steineri]